MSIRTNSRRLGLFIFMAAMAALFLATAAQAASPAIWRIDALSNSTAAAGSTYRLNLQLSNIGDAAADGSSGDPVVFTAALPPEMSVEGLQIENAFFGTQHSEGITIPTPYGIFDPATFGWQCSGDGPGPSPSIEGAENVSCSIPSNIPAHEFKLENGFPLKPTITVHVAPQAEGETLVTHFTLSGAGTPAASGAEVTRVAPEATFGIDSFDMGSFDASGTAYSAASGIPFALTTDLDFNTRHNPRLFAGDPEAPIENFFEHFGGGPAYQDGNPVEPLRDVSVDLPPGLVGQAGSRPQCTAEQLAAGGVFQTPDCPPGSQVGTIVTSVNPHLLGTSMFGPLGVYNLVPAPGSPATFGFNVYGTQVMLRARLRSESDYGISVLVPGISEGLDIAGNSLSMWGEPGSPSHDFERSCPNEVRPEYVLFHGATCEAEASGKVPFLRMPTSCTATGKGLPWSVAIDSWSHPGAFFSRDVPDLSDPAWKTDSIEGHEAPGYPLAPSEWNPEKKGVEGCGDVPFEPSLSVRPTTEAADSPSGLSVDLTMPQECWTEEGVSDESNGSACQSDLKRAVVRLPQGMTINPSAAGGLDACSSAQIGLTTPLGQAPVHFDVAPVRCPDASKVGSAEIQTPLLAETLHGAVYLGKQGDNPFRSLLAIYLVIENPQRGIEIKLPGHVALNESTGQLETVFDDNPQLPFSKLHLELFGGPRAALRTPPTCGIKATRSTLTGWANPQDPVHLTDYFEISGGANGAACPGGEKERPFEPNLNAGTQNPLAGSYSPFSLRLTREDGTQEIAGLSAHLPKGLIGKPAGIPYCPDAVLKSISEEVGTGAAQIAKPSCPAASQVGTVTVGAGAGPNPFYTTAGRAYWAGPYKGAPLSLAVVAPAVAGPFDLGNVVVRNALNIDPETAEVTAVSDPIPAIVHGIPLDLRDIRINLDRPDYILNPTSCEPMAIGATLTSTQGAIASPSNHFQVAGCDRLGFKPKLSLRLRGTTARRGHPALSATLTYPQGAYANIAGAQVTLPRSAFLDQSHIGTVCTRVQFAAKQCPPASVYGYARAITPLLDSPLEGPVYLRSSSHKLPDLVADLNGQIEVALDGRIDSVNGGIRTTFETVPDAPVSKFTLTMQGGKKGLIQNSVDLCAQTNRANALFDAQNGIVREFNPALKVKCGGAARKKRHR